MKKVVLCLSCVVSITLIASIVLLNSLNSDSLSIKANDNITWYHFPMVEPTTSTHGSKEFWTSSADNCQSHVLVDPGEEYYVEKDFSTYASFQTLDRDDDRYIPSKDEQHGITPVITDSSVTYGLYPQTHVNDETLIFELDTSAEEISNGWYTYNDDYYAKLKATPISGAYCFDDGTLIVFGETYWFKCEPITWKILSNNSGQYYLLSSVSLDACKYYRSESERTIGEETIYANNYEYSDVRNFLINDFYNSAFMLNTSYVELTTVDNSASTTISNDNMYACNDTLDYVFLPSYKDYINPNYGFPNKTSSARARYCTTTDWARARGLFVSSSIENNANYLTRSPSSNPSYKISRVCPDGSIDWYIVDTSYGVRPAIMFDMHA